MRLYTETEAPRGTPVQALAGWSVALTAGVVFWAVVLHAAWDELADLAAAMWP